MRRKSERTASKKTKASPEKKEKPEKPKKPKTRRRKQSASSDNESTDETIPVQPPETKEVLENNPPQTSTKEDSPEESNEVWHVKAAEVSGDVGEIQKLKICLTRPPTTPERVDRSPRSKRKHSRSASGEPSDERKKGKHRTRRAATESKEGSEKNQDSQGDEPDSEKDTEAKVVEEVSQSSSKQDTISDATPMSTTTDDTKTAEETRTNEDTNSTTESSTNQEEEKDKTVNESEAQEKPSDADTTVTSPKPEAEAEAEAEIETETENTQDSSIGNESESRKRTISDEKSEVLELHADESRCESSYIGLNDTQMEDTTRSESPSISKVGNSETDVAASEVSITDDKMESSNDSKNINSTEITKVATNKTNVVESSQSPEKEVVKPSSEESTKNQQVESSNDAQQSTSDPNTKSEERLVHNGQALTQSNRKRRWGSRPSRITTQKSITISTDVLKDIIPDVKPAEFDEVIEEKRHHKRIDVSEKLERPVLPKIVIDNTESVEINRKESEDRDKENVKIREPHMSSSRKISIVKDNESIIARPPSPPRHKQSNILFITNLVRPFTLPQLKNLLQRTGRIVENGFWIDRIKSKCFVQYETEDQAVETRHALHGVTWPVSNPKTLHVDFSTPDDFEKAKVNEETDSAQTSTIPGTVEDWLREQDMKRERGEMEKPWERKMTMREWDVGKNEKGKEKDKNQRPEDRLPDKRRHRTLERSPEPAKKFKKKEEEAPAKLLDDLFRKTKATPCIYWLPLSAETIAVKEEQRRQHMAEHERRLQELRRTHRRH